MSYDPNKKPINQSRLDEFTMSDDQVVKLVDKTMVGHVATRDQNQPFVIPTTFWYSKEVVSEVVEFYRMMESSALSPRGFVNHPENTAEYQGNEIIQEWITFIKNSEIGLPTFMS